MKGEIPVGVLFIIDENLLVVQSLLLLFLTFFCLPLPLVLFPFHALLQPRIIEILQFFLIALTLHAIINLVIFVESFLLYMTIRSTCDIERGLFGRIVDESPCGLKARLETDCMARKILRSSMRWCSI